MSAAAISSPAAMPFPAATGQGLRIAVIDSGVNLQHPHIRARTHGVVFPGDEHSWEDTVGHGTAVTAAIQEKAPAAEYFALKLFSRGLRTSSERLLQALDWTIENRMDVVNLSLGTQNPNILPALQSMVDRARDMGTVIVSARNKGPDPVLPGILDGVLGVAVDWDLPRHEYRVIRFAGETYFSASGYPRPLPGMPQTRNLNGISFAVANLTGIVARACEGLENCSVENVRAAMIAEAAACR